MRIVLCDGSRAIRNAAEWAFPNVTIGPLLRSGVSRRSGSADCEMRFQHYGCVEGERTPSLSTATGPSEEFLGRAIDQLPGVALLSFDSQMRFTSAAGGALGKAGYTPESLVGRRPELPGEAWQALEEHFAQTLKGQRDARTQVEFTLDGKVIYWALISPLRDADEGIVGGVLALRNTTAQPHVEAALAKSEREFREVTDQSADMLTRHDVEGRYLYVSPACEQVVGYQPEELIGHHPLQFVHPEDLERVTATIEQAVPGGAKGSKWSIASCARTGGACGCTRWCASASTSTVSHTGWGRCATSPPKRSRRRVCEMPPSVSSGPSTKPQSAWRSSA